MELNNINKFEKVHPYAFSRELEYMFVGEYIDGKFQFEYNPNNGLYYNVKEVNRNSLIRFGVVGKGLRSYFNTIDGSFKHGDIMFKFIYKDKNKEYDLTNRLNTLYNNIIHYKDACSILAYGGEARTSFVGYHYGYETNINYADGTVFYFKPLINFTEGKKEYLTMEMKSNRDIDRGQLIIRSSKGLDYITNSPLKTDIVNKFTWQIEI